MSGKLVRPVQPPQARSKSVPEDVLRLGKTDKPVQPSQVPIKDVPEEVSMLGKDDNPEQFCHANEKSTQLDKFKSGKTVNAVQSFHAPKEFGKRLFPNFSTLVVLIAGKEFVVGWPGALLIAEQPCQAPIRWRAEEVSKVGKSVKPAQPSHA